MTDASIPQPTFQQAMEITAQWLGLWENGELSDEVLSDRVAEMVASRDGARGFFVVSLAGDYPLMDRLPDPVVLALRQAGWQTIAQDEASSVVYGMPKAAAELGAAMEILPAEAIGPSLLRQMR